MISLIFFQFTEKHQSRGLGFLTATLIEHQVYPVIVQERHNLHILSFIGLGVDQDAWIQQLGGIGN